MRRVRRRRLSLSPPPTLRGVSVGLLPQRIPRCLPRGLGLHAGIAARIAPSDCSSAGLRGCAVPNAGGCRFPPSSAPHRVFVELLQHCIPRCPPRGLGLHAGIAAKTEPPDCRCAGPRRCAVPSMAAAAFPTVNPPQGLCGATAALHPWLASPWTRTARRDRRSACAWGCPGHWWQDERLLLSRGLGPSRRLRHARPEGGSYLGAAPLRVWPDGPPSSPPSTWRWCCLRHAASKREPDRDGPPWEARAGVFPPSPGWRTTVWRTTPGAGGSVLFLARCAVMGMAFSGRPVAGPTRRRPLGHGVGA